MSQRSTRDDIMDVAREMIATEGVPGTTMLKVATRAGASKETLYNWFGNKEGLIEAICLREAESINARLQTAIDDLQQPIRSTLEQLALGLLTALLSDWSLAINRAAMQSPSLAKTLLSTGRFQVGPMVGTYMESQRDRGLLNISDGEAAFQQFFGLVMQDFQIRALLFNEAIAVEQYPEHAAAATARFLEIAQP